MSTRESTQDDESERLPGGITQLEAPARDVPRRSPTFDPGSSGAPPEPRAAPGAPHAPRGGAPEAPRRPLGPPACSSG